MIGLLDTGLHTIARASAACLWAAGDRARSAGDVLDAAGHALIGGACALSELAYAPARLAEVELRQAELDDWIAKLCKRDLELEVRLNALVTNLGGIVPYVARVADRLEHVAQVADAPGPRLPTLEEERRRV